jgi:chemotaxis protein methyltransferase CheR
MELADQLKTALLERVGIRADITSAKIQARLEAIPEVERMEWVRNLITSPVQSETWQNFVETFLIHETYFFRHEHQLEFLHSSVLPALIQERIEAGRPEIRIWCAACSSGEEAYTAALLLRDCIQKSPAAKQLTWRASVIGTDLSAEVLTKARRGEYSVNNGLNSFRDVPAFARHHFPEIFQAGEKTWHPDAWLRQTVSFQQRNLISDPAPVSDADVILCRNVLIYLDEKNSQQALQTMRNALRPGGVLILGPADMLKTPGDLELLTNSRAMFWRKSTANRPDPGAPSSTHRYSPFKA